MKNKSFKINVKNGFYIGDLCYALNEKVYDEVWGGNNYEEGQYTDPETKAEFAMVGTAYGDGEYESSEEGLAFSVDAGIIGIADLAICDVDASLGKAPIGKVVPDYSGIVFIEYNDGTITVSWGEGADHKEIDIYTGYDDYDEDEEAYYEEDSSDEEERYDEEDDYGEDEEEDW